MNKIKREKGFTLIELLIVVAIILIIAAIAIPSLLRSRMAANQSSAAASERTLNTAAVSYYSNWNNGFPGLMSEIEGPPPATCNAGGYIDSVLGSGQKSGYNFVLVAGATVVTVLQPGCAVVGYSDGYVFEATPVSASTGTPSYCVDASGVIETSNLGTETLAGKTCNMAPLGN